MDEARKDIAAFRTRYAGKKTRIVGIFSQFVPNPRDNSISMQVAQFGSSDTVWAVVKAGPLADRLRQTKPGTVVVFSGTLTGATSKEDDEIEYGSDLLDGPPKGAEGGKKKLKVSLDFAADDVL